MRSLATARALTLTVALAALWVTPVPAQTAGEPIRLTGSAIDPNGGGTGQVMIDITRWSPQAEADRLLAILDESGQGAFLSALQKNRLVGSIRAPGQLAYDLHYASQSTLPDGGTQIDLATDRRLSFVEIRDQSRSINYPFIWIQIHLNNAGEGDGTLAPAVKLTSAGGRDVVMESYETIQPIRLSSLRKEKLKP